MLRSRGRGLELEETQRLVFDPIDDASFWKPVPLFGECRESNEGFLMSEMKHWFLDPFKGEVTINN
jgi:hypothetical protein